MPNIGHDDIENKTVQIEESEHSARKSSNAFPSKNVLNLRNSNSHAHKAYIENDLLKAANIYSQFDKKGNLFENRLYAKTSIN